MRKKCYLTRLVAINSSEKNLMFRKNNSMVLNQSRKPVSSINQVRREDQIITCIDDGEIISTIEEQEADLMTESEMHVPSNSPRRIL